MTNLSESEIATSLLGIMQSPLVAVSSPAIISAQKYRMTHEEGFEKYERNKKRGFRRNSYAMKDISKGKKGK